MIENDPSEAAPSSGSSSSLTHSALVVGVRAVALAIAALAVFKLPFVTLWIPSQGPDEQLTVTLLGILEHSQAVFVGLLPDPDANVFVILARLLSGLGVIEAVVLLIYVSVWVALGVLACTILVSIPLFGDAEDPLLVTAVPVGVLLVVIVVPVIGFGLRLQPRAGLFAYGGALAAGYLARELRLHSGHRFVSSTVLARLAYSSGDLSTQGHRLWRAMVVGGVSLLAVFVLSPFIESAEEYRAQGGITLHFLLDMGLAVGLLLAVVLSAVAWVYYLIRFGATRQLGARDRY